MQGVPSRLQHLLPHRENRVGWKPLTVSDASHCPPTRWRGPGRFESYEWQEVIEQVSLGLPRGFRMGLIMVDPLDIVWLELCLVAELCESGRSPKLGHPSSFWGLEPWGIGALCQKHEFPFGRRNSFWGMGTPLGSV